MTGELLPYVGRVQNCGNVDLLNVTVVHDNGTPLDASDDVPVLSIPVMAPGEKQGFFGTYQPSVPGGQPSTLTATGVGSPDASCGLPDVTASQSATCLSACDPCIDVILKCADAGTNGQIPFQGRIENCGNVDLLNVTVVHDNGTPLDTSDDVPVLTLPSLAPGDKQGFNGGYLPSVGPGEPSTLSASATASPDPICGLKDIKGTAEATCNSACNPCINVILKCNDAAPGRDITFIGRVQNCGNVDLMNVMLAHDNATPGIPGDDVLLVSVPLLPRGGAETFSGKYTPSVPPGTPSTLTATGMGTPPIACGPEDVSGSESATCIQN